ncbi:hypothetical protein WA588_003253 [Blastocystis sp. NMH]
MHVLQRVIYILVYNSMNDRNLSLILRNTLKEDNIMIMLALGVGLYNIIYDYYYIGHGSIQETQIGMARSVLFGQISLVDVLIHQTSILSIIRRSRLFDEYKACLEVIMIDTAIQEFCSMKLVASNVINEIMNDEWIVCSEKKESTQWDLNPQSLAP